MESNGGLLSNIKPTPKQQKKATQLLSEAHSEIDEATPLGHIPFKPISVQKQQVALAPWDLDSSQESMAIGFSFYRNAAALLLVCDLTRA